MSNQINCPYTPEEVAQLARNYGIQVASGIAGYVRAFAEDPTMVYDVLEPLLRSGNYRDAGGGAVRQALIEFANRTQESDRVELARREIESSTQDRPRLDFLEDLRCHELDDATAADVIIDAYQQTATNNDRRRDLLDIWDRCQITTPRARTALLDAILLDMVNHGGRQALEYVLARQQLWNQPEGRKRALKDAFRRVAGEGDLRNKAERLMREHDVITERKRAFGLLPSEEIDEE